MLFFNFLTERFKNKIIEDIFRRLACAIIHRRKSKFKKLEQNPEAHLEYGK